MKRLALLIGVIVALALPAAGSSKPPSHDSACGNCDGGGGLPYCNSDGAQYWYYQGGWWFCAGGGTWYYYG